MPELPEVEFGRKVASAAGLGRVIRSLEVEADEIVFCGDSPRSVKRRLKGARVEAVHRKGKYIWFALDRRPWPIFHFGMTGAFRSPALDPLKLASHGKQKDAIWPPRFAKIWMHFDDGNELVMTNARRLGRIRFAEDPQLSPPIAKLGFDPLLEMPRLPQFRRQLAARKSQLKGLLLDQSFAAGVGNWIADEVLYQAALDPRRRANELDADEQKRLHQKLRAVIQKAVEVDARKDRFPRRWLFHRRWGKQSEARTHDGERVEFLEIAGRTTAWVPTRQR